ncbi:MAG TPA: response regulator [Patescibacteria group bacterium]
MPTILLVDDDTEMLRLYKMILEEKFDVLTAESGEKALTVVKESHPDLVLLDIMMPAMNGIEVLEHIKADPETSATAVAMLTNLADENYKKSALEKGAKKYLIKSEFEPDELMKEIASLIPSAA